MAKAKGKSKAKPNTKAGRLATIDGKKVAVLTVKVPKKESDCKTVGELADFRAKNMTYEEKRKSIVQAYNLQELEKEWKKYKKRKVVQIKKIKQKWGEECNETRMEWYNDKVEALLNGEASRFGRSIRESMRKLAKAIKDKKVNDFIEHG